LDRARIENAYETPPQIRVRSAVGASHRFGWPFLVVGNTFLLINLALLAASKLVLVRVVKEFDLSLSSVSLMAYFLLEHWLALVAVWCGFAVGSSVVYFLLQSTRRYLARCFFACVTIVWLFFTVEFAFGILSPLYDLAMGISA
jgi:hypothetical protein